MKSINHHRLCAVVTRGVTICAFMLSMAAHAGPRYSVVPLHPGYEFGTEKALILDTVEGHLWIWMESPAVNEHAGGRFVIYQGQLVPGREMGEVMSEQRWAAPIE
jgi:hypothetical protein